jgi:hypothetical protein
MSTITIGNGIANAVTYTADTTGNLVFTTTGGVINASSMSGAVAIPSGTTNNRPTGVNGIIRYNTSTANLEAYVGGAWVTFP